MSSLGPKVIDCDYTGHQGVAAAYLLREGDEAAFIETNTNLALPHLLKGLEEEGLNPEQVRYIILTHIHLDHAGGAGALMQACPHATLLVHPRGAPHMIQPDKLIASATQIYGEEQFAALYGTLLPVPAERVRIMEDGEVLVFGARRLRFFYTRGHANHHFCIHDDALDAVFAGDNFGITYPALQEYGRFVFPSSPPTDFDADAALQSIDKILAVGAKRVFPTHYGEVRELAETAASLREQLSLYQAWLEEAYSAGLAEDALDAFFVEKVRGEFAQRMTSLGFSLEDERRKLCEIDIMLNAQGLAFAVKKRRFKEQQANA
ncbi:MAG: MBL fold metallo-hydrolase [Myxococcales bacterium]|nr:MBL fold metallo-hydrolase [Myxococcales bacterium]MCB9641581.1 MBL fold metallo-hydrolase [Myxococcales bacterium]